MPTKPITAERLVALRACHDQVKLFRDLFPNGAPLTVEAAIAVADKFHWDWAAETLLSATGLQVYRETTAPARKARNETRAPALKVYDEAMATAMKVYDKTMKALNETMEPALKVYDEAMATAMKVYDDTMEPALKVYYEATAPAFARAYLNDKD